MADEEVVWTPDVQRKDHPFGEQGVVASLEAVAERVALGATSPKVRMWAIECLDRARKERGWKMDTEKERAIVLLEACQQKLWVPDPIGYEWMAGAHLMACDADKDGVCFRGNDCDDKTILLGACFSGVGLYTAVVGHAYDRDKNISHVLTSVWVNGRWMYADPSTDLPLGECVKFTRERVYSVPNIKMICDSNVCFTHPQRFDPDKNDFVGKGGFVGVSGPPKSLDGVPDFAWLTTPTRKVQWLGAAAGESKSAGDQIQSATQRAALNSVRKAEWPPTDEDMERVAGAVGGAAAAAACTAYGAGAAAPLCAKIGQVVSEFIADKVVGALKNLFARRNRDAWRQYRERVAHATAVFAAYEAMVAISTIQGEELTKITDTLEATYQDLYGVPSGGDWADWRRVLAFVGAPMIQDAGALSVFGAQKNSPLYVPATNPVAMWNSITDQLTPQNVEQFVNMVQQKATTELEAIGHIASVVVAKMAADATARRAEEAARMLFFNENVSLEALALFDLAEPIAQGSKKKKSSALPVVVFGLAAVGAAWWFL